tara:strand:- start:194 stop:418 length:225 start_codon:yes stop_codon:yes gene_type:complete
MRISKRELKRIIKEEKVKLQEQMAGGMGHVPAPDPDHYDLGYDDGMSEEEPDPMYIKNASYMKGYEDGLMDMRG